MRIPIKDIKELKKYPNSIYVAIKKEFVYHSNKIEGSSFLRENIDTYLNSRIIEGRYHIDDILETINSLELFDYVIDTLGKPLNKDLILKFHTILKNNTMDKERGLVGCWKKVPNEIIGYSIKLAEPCDVDANIGELLSEWNNSEKSFVDIVKFHSKFEGIHPFQDGNGRVGRFIMLKQSLESNIDIISVDERYSLEYKKALFNSQMKNDFTHIEYVLTKSQQFLEDKSEMLKDILRCLEELNTVNK